jgi:type I site-specific restriction endonuclease
MEQLNLPHYTFKFTQKDEKTFIYDEIRRKNVALTPEEWVRQNFVKYLVNDLKYPASRMAIEHALMYHQQKKKADIVFFDEFLKPFLIVECKASSIKINDKVFEQAARYNMTLKVKYLIVTNGLNHYCCQLNYENNSYDFLQEIPPFLNPNNS